MKKQYALKLASLTKKGIILGNLLPVFAGFFVGLKYFPNKNSVILCGSTIFWSCIVIASGCVLNNWFDAELDRKMDRTKNRALPMQEVSQTHALIFGTMLCIIGIFGMTHFVNKLAGGVALFGIFAYTILYTVITKRNSIYGVHIGSISGAIPPVIGYTAVSGVLDINALCLFVIIVLWQMPHSFAIEVFRYNDYKNAEIPTVPSVKGLVWTKWSSIVYITLFLIVNAYFSFKTGAIHLVASLFFCGYWLKLARRSPQLSSVPAIPNESQNAWAKKVFFGSIITMTGICVSIILNCGIFLFNV
jgi:protoheme IX farnesyltransferase